MRDPLFWDLSFRKGFRGPVRGQMSATSKATVEQGLGVHITGHVYRDYEETLPPANCSGPLRPRKQPYGALLRPQNYHNLAATYPSKNPSPGIEPSKPFIHAQEMREELGANLQDLRPQQGLNPTCKTRAGPPQR